MKNFNRKKERLILKEKVIEVCLALNISSRHKIALECINLMSSMVWTLQKLWLSNDSILELHKSIVSWKKEKYTRNVIDSLNEKT